MYTILREEYKKLMEESLILETENKLLEEKINHLKAMKDEYEQRIADLENVIKELEIKKNRKKNGISKDEYRNDPASWMTVGC